MAYKRYVHRKGKRHGPYYYKNVRDVNGKVRSIYLGKVTARGKKPLELTIVFLTALLIIISALFFIQNRNIVLSMEAAEEAVVPFEVDQILIKVLVKADEYIEKELRAMNVGNEEVPIDVFASGISDIVKVLDSSFTIKPGQTKIVRLNFSSFNRAEGTEQAPGVYIGKITAKSDSYEKEVPVIIEIESKNVLFDMNLNPVARDRSVLQGESTTFEIRVFNLQSIESSNVDMDFFVKDINGNTIISERESVVVKTQASFFKTLKIPQSLKTGNYVFAAQASFGNSIGTASYLFEVEKVVEERRAVKFIEFCRNDPLCWALSLIVLLLLFALGAYAYFFIGAFIYQKLFGIAVPKKSAEEARAEGQIFQEKKENPIISSFRHLGDRIRRANERRAKKKLEFEVQKLKLEEKKEKLKLELEEEKEKLKEKREGKEEERGGLTGKCRNLIDKGYRALGKSNLKEADKAYIKIMEMYMGLPGERKAEIFKEINSFYKSLLLKKQQAKQMEEAKKKREVQIEKEKEIAKKREEEGKLKEKERKTTLMEEEKKVRKKKIFEFFHGLGMVKTEEEKKETEKQKEIEGKRKSEEDKRREEEKRKREIERARQKEEEQKRKKEIEEQKQREAEEKQRLEEERRIKLEDEEKKKEEEKRKKEIERAMQKEEIWKRKAEEEGRRKAEEQKRKKEIEEQKQREAEEKQRLEEERRINLEKEKNKEEENRKARELEKKKKDAERIKEQEEKNRKLEEIRELERNINGNDAEISRLKEKIKAAYSGKSALAGEISGIKKDIGALNNEKQMLFKAYNESLGSMKQAAEERKSRLADWKNKYDSKLNEKEQANIIAKEEYENELKELEDELQGLSRKDREDLEKWKRLELKAKYKLEEKEKERAISEEIKSLQAEKEEIEKKLNEKKQAAGKDTAGRDILQRQKDIDDHIREHEKGIEELNRKIGGIESSLERYSNNIEKLEKEKEKAKDELRNKKKELGGLSYLPSIFKFRRKEKLTETREAGKKEKEEKPKAIAEKEPGKAEETREKKIYNFFHSLGLVKTEEEKKEIERQRETERKKKEEARRKAEEEEKKKEEEKRKKELERARQKEEIWKRKAEEEERRKAEEQKRKKEIEEQKQREAEEKQRLEEERKHNLEAERQKELERKKKENEERRINLEKEKSKEEENRKAREPEGKRQEEETKRGEKAKEGYDLEKSLKELGDMFERKKKEKKPGIIQRIMESGKKAERPEDAKARMEIRKKREGKSSLFVKCHKLMLKADEALQSDAAKAKKLYLKTRELYIKLEYLEKKEIYDELAALYNKLAKR